MGVSDGSGDLIKGKIARIISEGKLSTAQINRISTIVNRNFKFSMLPAGARSSGREIMGSDSSVAKIRAE